MDKGCLIRRARYFFKSIAVIAITLLLASCFSKAVKQDGPPNFYVDASKIPNAVPKPERLAHYGNMSTYYVFGKRYQPMKSSRNYQEVGIASWYGTRFHARRTSSGERYDMLAMTAAHKTLPLPTYVEVTNLQNHRKIIVKVNDRGPFKANRIIDLSYVAAKKLGMSNRGTATVKIKAIDPYAYQRVMLFANNDNFTRKSSYSHQNNTQLVYLHVGTFHNKNNAERLKRRLINLLATPVNIASSKKSYQVRIGPIKDIAVDKINYQLKHFGIKTATSHAKVVPAWDPLQRNGSR